MIYIALGIFGFIVLHLFNLVSLKRIPFGAKGCLWAAGSSLVVYSLIMLCLKSNTLPLPIWLTWLGWGLLPISLFLLIYSLFINLPFGKTYINTGIGDKLVTTGLYALVRHPWVHCFALILLSLVMVSKSSLLLIALPMWLWVNILLVAIQDRFFFGRMFAGYDRYRRETPMLIPNRRSVNAFISSLRQHRA